MMEPRVEETKPVTRAPPIGDDVTDPKTEPYEEPPHREQPIEFKDDHFTPDQPIAPIHKPEGEHREEAKPEEPTPVLFVARDPVPEELKRETVQPVTRAPDEVRPEGEDKPPIYEDQPKPVVLPIPVVVTASEKEEPREDVQQPELHREPKKDSDDDEGEERPAPVIVAPVHVSERQPEREEPKEEPEPPRDESKPITQPVVVERAPEPEEPKREEFQPVGQPNTAPEPPMEALAAPIMASTPIEREPQPADTQDDFSQSGDSEEESQPEERPVTGEPSLVICPPASTDWEADDTPMSPDTATLPIRHPTANPATENEITEFSPPTQTRPRHPSSSSDDDSIRVDSEEEGEFIPADNFPVHQDAPLADLEEEDITTGDSDTEIDEEDEEDQPTAATGPETPLKTPDTTVSHPKVLHYEQPKSDNSSQSASPPLADQPEGEGEHSDNEPSFSDPETAKQVKDTLDNALKELDQSSPEEAGSGSASPASSDTSPSQPTNGGRRDSGFMSLPREMRPDEGQNNNSPNKTASPSEAEHANKMAGQILEEAKKSLNEGQS